MQLQDSASFKAPLFYTEFNQMFSKSLAPRNIPTF